MATTTTVNHSKIDPEVIEEARRWFTSRDLNNDGHIDVRELQQVLCRDLGKY
jgi:Ca2+-binding EF-hand superfamily protein